MCRITQHLSIECKVNNSNNCEVWRGEYSSFFSFLEMEVYNHLQIIIGT